MKTVMLVLVLLFGVAVVVGDQCGASEVGKCASKYKNGISAAGEDLNKLCQVYRAYVNCIDSAGCSGNDAFTAFKKDVSDGCGVAAEGTDQCNTTEVSKCASTLEVDLPAVGENLTKVCQVSTAYVDCIDRAGCSGIATFAAVKKDVSAVCGLSLMESGQCNSTEAETCSQKHTNDASAAGKDVSKQCQVHRAYIDCLDRSGCSGNDAFTAAKNQMSALCGVAVVVADQCDTTELAKCSLKHAHDLFAAGEDLNKLHQVFREYADCIGSSGCSGNAAFATAKKDVSAVCGNCIAGSKIRSDNNGCDICPRVTCPPGKEDEVFKKFPIMFLDIKSDALPEKIIFIIIGSVSGIVVTSVVFTVIILLLRRQGCLISKIGTHNEAAYDYLDFYEVANETNLNNSDQESRQSVQSESDTLTEPDHSYDSLQERRERPYATLQPYENVEN